MLQANVFQVRRRSFGTNFGKGLRVLCVSVITIIDVVMFTLFDGFSGDAEWEGSDRAPCRLWC